MEVQGKASGRQTGPERQRSLLVAPGPLAGGLVQQVKVLATRLDDKDPRSPRGGKRRRTP